MPDLCPSRAVICRLGGLTLQALPVDTGGVSVHRFQKLWGLLEPVPRGPQGQLSLGGVYSCMWIFSWGDRRL